MIKRIALPVLAAIAAAGAITAAASTTPSEPSPTTTNPARAAALAEYDLAKRASEVCAEAQAFADESGLERVHVVNEMMSGLFTEYPDVTGEAGVARVGAFYRGLVTGCLAG